MLEPERSEADRLELAGALRDLRRSRGVTGESLGRRVYMSQTKISRIETGRITPSVTDVELIVHALHAAPQRSRELVALARVANTEFRPDQIARQRGWAARQRELKALEGQCRVKRHFLPTMLTGLEQTAQYAGQAITNPADRDPSTVAEIVQGKRQRQQILHDETKEFVFLHTEAALRWMLLDGEGMAAQLEHLAALARQPNVLVAVILFDARVPLCVLSVFTVYDDRLATVETSTGTVMVRDPTDVRYYLDLFASFQQYALRGDRAREFVLAVADDVRRRTTGTTPRPPMT